MADYLLYPSYILAGLSLIYAIVGNSRRIQASKPIDKLSHYEIQIIEGTITPGARLGYLAFRFFCGTLFPPFIGVAILVGGLIAGLT